MLSFVRDDLFESKICSSSFSTMGLLSTEKGKVSSRHDLKVFLKNQPIVAINKLNELVFRYVLTQANKGLYKTI